MRKGAKTHERMNETKNKIIIIVEYNNYGSVYSMSEPYNFVYMQRYTAYRSTTIAYNETTMLFASFSMYGVVYESKISQVNYALWDG